MLTGILLGTLLPALSRTSNCGGNTAALAICNNCVLSLYLASGDETKPFNINSLSAEKKAEIVKSIEDHWNLGANFFVRTNVPLRDIRRQILVVCDQPFNNVPQPTLWNGFKQTPKHAVGYSDGNTGLITPTQFKELNLSEFIEGTKLKTNAVLTTYKGSRL